MSGEATQQTDQNEPVVTPETEQQEQHKAPDTSWVPKRISEITAARRAAEDRAARAEQELAALRASQAANSGQPATPVAQKDIEALAQSYAERKYRDMIEVKEVNDRISAINAAGIKEFGDDFQKSVDNLNAAGIGGPEFLKAIAAIPNGEKLVTWLGKTENVNEAMRVATLDPVQMGVEMMKLQQQAIKAFTKPVSKAPPPVTELNGRGTDDGNEPDPSNVEAWVAWRNKNRKSRR